MLTLIKVTTGKYTDEISIHLPSGTFIILDDENILVKEEDYVTFYSNLSVYPMTVIYRQPK